MKINSIFDAKSMPENVMQKAVKIMPNGCQNEVRIMYNSIKMQKKDGGKIAKTGDCKNLTKGDLFLEGVAKRIDRTCSGGGLVPRRGK